ncbi:conserved hypothetical protein [uncultured Spirochaetota bacterium]|uniref:Uncharacterized protein n=1 Tax=uncultured Spirochaetota bacterium TaxID=460511 RepID=A0A652ZT75_9SPIR|nr:conserved hypothetical protein [uncultured Spirochaetota bacterium]
MPNSERLELKIALDTLRHLGLNLYSSLPPVLSELVANSYDARSRRVDITLKSDSVEIKDDGIGMDREDMQNKYLIVGLDKRLTGCSSATEGDPFPEWPRRDTPMGRKGIGKLAMFSIASEVEIQSIKRGAPVAIRMKRDDIERQAKASAVYNPEEIALDPGVKTGTKITLSKLKRSRAINQDAILRALARRFSVIDLSEDEVSIGTKWPQTNFSVYVNGIKVSIEHWDLFKKIEYLWILGPESAYFRSGVSSECKVIEVSSILNLESGKSANLSGWIGTVKKPEQLKTAVNGFDINDNRIVVDCRGKVAISNFLHQFGESGMYASYLAGYIKADYLDEAEDIATSDRERMQDDDPKVQVLKDFVRKLLKRIQMDWTDFRRKSAADNAEHDPIIAEWLATLNGDEQSDAKTLLGRLGSVRYTNASDKPQVLKYAILAFERLRVRHKLSLLKNATDEKLETIATMFALESDLENALYADIASQRLNVVRELTTIVDENSKERIIQRHIFDNLWLVEPSWTLQDQLGARMEERITKEFSEVKLNEEEEKSRFDIRYRKSGGIHIIIELKRPKVSRTVDELIAQVKKYKKALKRCLAEVEGDLNPRINCLCLVGSLPMTDEQEQNALNGYLIKINTYDMVINDSYKRFSEYINAQKRFNGIQAILAKLDEKDTEAEG